MRETLNPTGRLALWLTDRRGRTVLRRSSNNRIVLSGRDLVARFLAGDQGGPPPSRITHMAVGIGAEDAADQQTRLEDERDPRKEVSEVEMEPFEEATPEGPVERVRLSLTAVFDFGEANGPEPLREAGMFTAEAEGVMYNRVVFDAVTKTDAFQLTLLWDVIL